MATSRTGTAQWKRLRKRKLFEAQQQGITHCPWCETPLNYGQSGLPNSPELDHIGAWSTGGQDTTDNTTVICRRCNQSKGNRTAPKPQTILGAKPLKTSRTW